MLEPAVAAARHVSEDAGVPGAKEALAGARDIVAERCAQRADVKQHARQALEAHAVFTARRRPGADEEGQYRTYWEFDTPVQRVRPHQFLAVQRGEAAKALTVGFAMPSQVATVFIEDLVVRVRTVATPQAAAARRTDVSSAWEAELRAAVADAYQRLIRPSLEREWRRRLKERAEDSAFDTYHRNLRAKLMLPPLRMHPVYGSASSGARVVAVLGIDPAYRTGCKLALINMTGQVLATRTVYPHPPYQGAQVPPRSAADAAAGLQQLFLQGLQAQAGGAGLSGYGQAGLICSIGNGTASRETEAWLRQYLRTTAAEGNDSSSPGPVAYTVVDEAGASVYSASPLAAKELPDLDVSMRGAVSIARRLLDPLSELVKIDPHSIGVGLYQHDVDQKRLARELKGCTEDCVNAVGVDLNTASPALLTHVAGLSASLAQAVVAHREAHGPFASRRDLLAVRGLGQRAFHQAAGFLRVFGSPEPLDALPVHPESYEAARALQQRHGGRAEGIGAVDIKALAAELSVGAETLADIASALAGTAADPRSGQAPVRVKSALGQTTCSGEGAVDAQEAGLTVDMLRPGMRLEGVVRNVVAFGAFVDVGVGHDGLLHTSEYPPQANATLGVNDRVEVSVLSLEQRGSAKGKDRWRIALSMRRGDSAAPPAGKP